MARVTDPSDRFLAHYGVPGMKWGRRRSKGQIASSKNAATPFPKNRPAKGTTDISPKPLKQISDKELRERLERIRMETQYKELTTKAAPKSKAKQAVDHMNKGHKVVIGLLAVAATAQKVYKLYNSPMVREMRGLDPLPEPDKKKKKE